VPAIPPVRRESMIFMTYATTLLVRKIGLRCKGFAYL